MAINRLPAIIVNDATFLHAGGLSRPHSIALAAAIEQAGVDEIELPTPTTTKAIADVAAIAAGLSQARINLRGGMTRRTVHAALRAGLQAVHLSMPLQQTPPRQMASVIRYGCERGLNVTVSGEHASRVDFALVCEALTAAEAAGAQRFRFVDSDGILNPLQTHRLFRLLCAETDLELEFRGHDEFGLATANTLAAIDAGATHVSVSTLTYGGSGRAAIAPLAAVVSALSLSPLHHTHVRLPWLASLTERVTAASGHLSAPTPIDIAHVIPVQGARQIMAAE